MSKLEEKAKKSKRIEKNKAVINKRVKVAKAHGMKTDQRNRFKKKHPLDCGRANCGLCSSPRKWGEKTMQEQKHEQKDRFDTDGEENKNS